MAVAIPASSPWPRWVNDLHRLLPVRSQFVLTGNVRDVYLTPTEDGLVLMPLLECLWEALRTRGYDFLLVHDRTDGVRVYPDTPAHQGQVAALTTLQFAHGRAEVSLARLPRELHGLIQSAEVRAALVLDYASRLATNAQHPSEAEFDLFAGCEKLARLAHPVPHPGDCSAPLYNPLIWVCERDTDLPSWYLLDNELVHLLALPRPHYEDRQTAAAQLAPAFSGCAAADAAARADFAKTFANLSEGMSLRALLDITQLARAQRLGFGEIADAVRSYQVGTLENPWKRDYLRERIRSAEADIARRVKGQPQAVSKTVDILIRSVMGLTGAHTVARSGRPRGVLFFAGPTGVGKTELAKALTQVLFSDERAYIRFDMSEFAAEHADARLLGAPPGYVGYEAGGELTNALRERPFSVLLFDEIEKAHPRVLDKFLQILEDGRITDGRGNTVYFSESLIVFTSNLGIFVPGPDGGRVQNVAPGDPYEQVESKVRQAIDNHFKYQLNRPEILNRIGDNIVVFDFIAPATAAEIFSGMLQNVCRRLREEHAIELEIAAAVREQLQAWCIADLSHGGRGIGNRLETVFVNPLGRALFQRQLGGTAALRVIRITREDAVYAVRLE